MLPIIHSLTIFIPCQARQMSDEHFFDRFDVHYDEFADAFNAEMHCNTTVYNRRVKTMHRSGTMNDVVCIQDEVTSTINIIS